MSLDPNSNCRYIVHIQQIENQLTEIQQKLNRLLDGYVSGLITPTEYQEKKQVLIEQKVELKQKLDSLQRKPTGWFELARDVILTCKSVEKTVKEKNYQKLVEIGQKAGSNFVLKDKQLSFSLKEPFNFIAKNNYSVKKIPFSYFQTAKSPFPDFNFLFQNNSLCRSWRCLSNYVRTYTMKIIQT